MLGIGGRISFPGWLTGDAVGRLLAEATLLTLPSYAEGLPMAVLEALAAGYPLLRPRSARSPISWPMGHRCCSFRQEMYRLCARRCIV